MALKISNIDTKLSKASFKIKKMGFLDIKGTLTGFQGSIVFDETVLKNAKFNVILNAITINTGNNKRDEHLKSKDFFYVKEFPTVHFQSTKIKRDNNRFLVTGKLSLLKQTREVSIPFTYEGGTVKGNFSINRMDYGLGIKFPAFFVGKTVKINIKTSIK